MSMVNVVFLLLIMPLKYENIVTAIWSMTETDLKLEFVEKAVEI